MRIAIPISEDGVARVFDSATRLLIVDLLGGNRYESVEVPTYARPPQDRALELVSLGVDVLFCERVSSVLANRIREQGIEVKIPASADVQDVINTIVRNPPGQRLRRAHAA